MKEKKKLGLGVWIMIGLAAGIAFGAILWATMGAEAATDFTASYLKPFGDIFVNLLKFIVVPLVLLSIMDGMFSFPFILLAMILITVLGNGVMNVILAIGIASVPGFARVTRGQVLIVKEEEYCNACRVVGVSPVRLLFLHILQNCVSQIIVYATLRIASAIISEASLSFLGLGIALPTASWGSILRVGRDCLTTAPHVAGTAGAFILVTVIGFNLLGDGIRDVMDPKMKQ